MASLTALKTDGDFASFVASGLSLVHFWAPWAEECRQMSDVMGELAKINPVIKFGTVEAEELPEVSEKAEITAVPTVIMYHDSKPLGRVDGANAQALAKLVDAHKGRAASVTATATPPAAVVTDERLKQLINAAPVMLFMKGTPDEPRCGFSRKIVATLSGADIKFSSFNILEDQAVREGLKTYSDWPTFPQLYITGDLVGGLDIVNEMVESGQIKDVLPSAESLNDRLAALTSREDVMVFIKGTPDAPRCGFSRTLVQMFGDIDGLDYGYYDILGDEEVRQGLKKYSDWPTYPQVYKKGELLGGLDIIKAMKEAGELNEALLAK